MIVQVHEPPSCPHKHPNPWSIYEDYDNGNAGHHDFDTNNLCLLNFLLEAQVQVTVKKLNRFVDCSVNWGVFEANTAATQPPQSENTKKYLSDTREPA